MKYLEFLHKLQQRRETGQPLSDDISEFTPDERHYLLHNMEHLPIFGGRRAMLNHLASLLKIEAPEILSLDVCLAAITREMSVLKRISVDETGNTVQVFPAQEFLSRALYAAITSGDGETLDILRNIDPANRIITKNDCLMEAAYGSNGKLMHHLLHESMHKNAYRQSLIQSLIEQFDFSGASYTHELPKIVKTTLERNYSGSANPDAFEAIITALPEQYRNFVIEKASRSPLAGNAITNVVLKHYPKALIGRPHPRAEEDERYKDRVQDSDEILFVRAARVGNVELLQYILDKYKLPEQRFSLYFRDQGILQTPIEQGDHATVKFLLDHLPEQYRPQLMGSRVTWQLTKVAERHDKKMFGLLLAALPPEQERTDDQRCYVLEARLLLDPNNVSKEEIVSTLVRADALSLKFLFERALNHSQMLSALASALPDAFLDTVKNPINPHYAHNTQNKARLIAAASAGLRREVITFLASVPDQEMMPIHSDGKQPITDWHQAFNDAAWLKELPGIITDQNPHGFDIEIYKQFLPLMQTACMLEGNDGAELHAYKLATLFRDKRKAEMYLTKYAPRDEHQPIHDALLFDLPKEGQFDVESWRQFGLRDGMGPRALKLLALAPKIEQAFAGKPSSQWNTKKLSAFRALTVDKLYDLARTVAYTHASQHPELANLCVSLGVEETVFNEARAIYTQPLPKKHTPDIQVDGKDIGFPGFHFRRMPPDHPWCAFIGKLVNCCNYIGGHTEEMAKAQIKHPDCSLYVLTDKKGEPVAKCTGWMSEKGNFVFNAWERLSPAYDKMCEPFLLAAALQAFEENPKIRRVTLGTNKGNAPFMAITDPEKPTHESLASHDANTQFEVATREKMHLASTKLRELAKRRVLKLRGEPLREEQDPWVFRRLHPSQAMFSQSA